MISDAYFPRVNGVSTSIRSFAQELARQGHGVTLLAPAYPADGHYPPYRDEREHFEIVRIASGASPLYAEDRLMSYRQLRRLAPGPGRGKIDVVHLHTPFVAHYAGVGLARRLGVPVLESYHTFFEEYLPVYCPALPPAWGRRFARFISRSHCRAVDGVVVPSAVTAERLARYGLSTPVDVIPTGLDLREFAAGDGQRFRRRLGIPAEAPLLLHVSRVAYEKNIDFILRMFALLARREPAARLAVCGEGPALDSMRRLAQGLGIAGQVHFAGYLERSGELLDAYRAADAFVFASRTETQGLVLLEALALGVPVVSTAELGTREVLREGAGALIAPEHETAFAERVLAILRDPELRRRLSLAAREYVRGWSAAGKAAELAGVYRRLIEERGAVRSQRLFEGG